MNGAADPRPEEAPCGRLVTGVHSVRIPVSDPWASRDWYVAILGFESLLDLEEAERVVGVLLRHPSGIEIGLHHDPHRAAALAGFVLLSLAVPDRRALNICAHELDQVGQRHSRVEEGHVGWHLDLPDPDGVLIRLHSFSTVDAEEA